MNQLANESKWTSTHLGQNSIDNKDTLIYLYLGWSIIDTFLSPLLVTFFLSSCDESYCGYILNEIAHNLFVYKLLLTEMYFLYKSMSTHTIISFFIFSKA